VRLEHHLLLHQTHLQVVLEEQIQAAAVEVAVKQIFRLM
jgi:hypothetical protein